MTPDLLAQLEAEQHRPVSRYTQKERVDDNLRDLLALVAFVARGGRPG